MKLLLVIVAAVAVFATVAVAEESSFKRDRRTLETAAMALESLRSSLASQTNNIFTASAALRNVASQADVTAVEEGVFYLASRIETLADAETVNNMTDSVNNAIQMANTANVLGRQVAESLPPLRSRSEAALDSSLSLLKHFANQETSVQSFEEAFRAEYDSFNSAVETVSDSANNFLDSTNFTVKANDFHSRADAIIEFMGNIDLDAYTKVKDSMALTNYLNPNTPVYRWRSWSSYSYSHGWFAGNDAQLYGGVNPSTWADGSGYAHQMSQSMEDFRTFFTNRGVSGYSANIFSQEYYYYSSTDCHHTAVAFRIKNTGSSTVTWNIRYYYFNYGSWSEASSIAVNGQNYYTYTSNCGLCSASVNVNIPANGISTVVVISASSNPSSTRGTAIGFYDNCLQLPANLEYVDDLPVAVALFEAI